MINLTSKKWIIIKGILFFVIAVSVTILILVETPSIKSAMLLVLLIWSACRFYYFLFYVLEHYVDSTMRYTGVLNLLMSIYCNYYKMRHDT